MDSSQMINDNYSAEKDSELTEKKNKLLSDTDSIFMRAYASAIKNKFQLDVGKNYCMLISPVTQRGIAAGKLIDPAITNYLIYKFADALQYSDNPSYTGGSAGSYIQQMRSYIEWVDLKRDVSTQATDVVQTLTAALTAANDEYWSILGKAWDRYNQFKELFPGQDFWQWARIAYLPLEAAHAVLRTAQTKLYQAMQQHYGPNYAVLSTYMDNIMYAQSSTPLPGLNQDGLADDYLIEQAIDKANEGQKFPITQSTIRVPAYSITSYSSTVQGWITASEQGATRDQIITIDSKQGRQTDWTDFGFNKVSPTLRGSAEVWSFFSAEVYTRDGQRQSRVLDTNGLVHGLDDYISLQLAMIGIAKFDIRPGEWDIPDIKTLFPDRYPNAPTILSPKVAKMVSVLVGYDVELRLEFASEVRDKVDDIIKEVEATGGSMSVFGFRVSVPVGGAGGAGGSLMRVDTKFKDVTWEKAKGLLLLTPTKGQVYPTILGAVAQRFQD